jgi:hypothetical protein
VAVIVVYPSRYIPTYDAASGCGSSGDRFASRPILRSRAATQKNGNDNPNPDSVLFHKVLSSNPKCATQRNIYMTWKIIRSGENRISAFVFPYQDKGPRFTFDQAADARGDFLAETGRRLR